MNRRGWLIGAGIAGAAAAIGFLLGHFVDRLQRERTTTTRLSPDETTRAWLVELGADLPSDRNVAIRLERVRERRMVGLLLDSSVAEGRPPGTERFLWSKDGTKLLLVGRHFFVRANLMLEGGDQLYFLHDLKSGRSWINSADDNRFPPLTADLIAGVEFTEPVALKPRAKVAPDSPEKRD